MKDRLTLKNHLIALGFVAALTTVWAALEGVYYFHSVPPDWWPAEDTWAAQVTWSLGLWSPWILLTPPILIVCRRFPLRKGAWGRSLAAHLLAALLFGFVKSIIESLLLGVLIGFTPDFVNLGVIVYAFFCYWFFPVVYSGVSYYHRYREREVKAGRLEAKLAEAKLDALKIPLRPHFLFNTLNAVSTLIHLDAKAADRMICRLSELLRHSLDTIDQQEVPLHQEIDFLNKYLEIERIRFSEKLDVAIEVDEEAKDAYVPNLLLQPLVENAVNHGIDPTRSKGRIDLRAFRRDGMLIIEISDNGPGLPGGDPLEAGGIGLRNTMARLKQLYGSEGDLSFDSSEEGGLLVRISLPFHRAPRESFAELEERHG